MREIGFLTLEKSILVNHVRIVMWSKRIPRMISIGAGGASISDSYNEIDIFRIIGVDMV